MAANKHAVEAALRSGSRAKNFAGRIADLCRELPDNTDAFSDEQLAAVLKLAALCRASRSVSSVLSSNEVPLLAQVPSFHELFCELYYPVLEDGKRTVGFWSVRDRTTLSPDDVHEWVSDTKLDKKTGKREQVAVPFGTWWRLHRPDYDLYGIACDIAAWGKKIIDVEGRMCVNSAYGNPPVLSETPRGYGDGKLATRLLDLLLTKTISDPDPQNAQRKRDCFVLDVGAHLLALRDSGDFRCRKVFCFTSTNDGQGTGKSVLQESIAALVPRGASCTVPTTSLAGDNLLPLYSSTVCILTEAPSTASERYTAEDVKSFADAGWKTAQEKYVAKRSVRDNSLKLLSSNHLSPLPIDSQMSRRFEFFVAEATRDGGAEIRAALDLAEQEMGWSADGMRACIGWALLLRAQAALDAGRRPIAVARRTIDAKHILSVADYDFFSNAFKNGAASAYNDYRDFRSDRGLSWSPDRYRFEENCKLGKSIEQWLDNEDTMPPEPPSRERSSDDEVAAVSDISDTMQPTDPAPVTVAAAAPEKEKEKRIRIQYKRRMKTAFLEPDTLSIAAIYRFVTTDEGLRSATEGVRAGTADKREVLRQIFPGATFDRFSRRDNIVSFNGLTHVDFDHISARGDGVTAEQVRDTLAEMPGFVLGGLSSRGDGAWAIFNAGAGIADYDTYLAAERSLFAAVEDRIGMSCDHALRLPTAGRTLGYDPDCRICDEALAGMMPEPYPWKAPTFAAAGVKLRVTEHRFDDIPVDEQIRNENFLEVVVTNSCEKIQNAKQGERHDTAIKAVANVVLTCQERRMTPLHSWGRRLRDACISCGLANDETNSIMDYWRQKTGMSC